MPKGKPLNVSALIRHLRTQGFIVETRAAKEAAHANRIAKTAKAGTTTRRRKEK